jgi:hypothetical protein
VVCDPATFESAFTGSLPVYTRDALYSKDMLSKKKFPNPQDSGFQQCILHQHRATEIATLVQWQLQVCHCQRWCSSCGRKAHNMARITSKYPPGAPYIRESLTFRRTNDEK